MTKQLHTAAPRRRLPRRRPGAHRVHRTARILEGPQGFFAAMAPARSRTASSAIRSPDGRSTRPASSRGLPAAMPTRPSTRRSSCGDRRRRREAGRSAHVRDALAFCDRAEPRTPIDAKFSLQHAVAVALLDGPPPLERSSRRRFRAPISRRCAAKVEVAAVRAVRPAYPARFGAGVEVELVGWTSSRRPMPDALGDPENPLSVEGVRAKAPRS